MVFDGIKAEERAKKILKGAIKSGRIPGAYLFCGHDQEEMLQFAKDVARALNCPTSCGTCINCRKTEEGVHPDFIVVSPEGKKGIIKIDAVRQLKDRIKFGPSEGSYAVVAVTGADSIEQAAANSFLKVLEEPPEKVLFILITARKDNIPRTVLSRCQTVLFTNRGNGRQEDIQILSKNEIPDILGFSAGLALSARETEREDVLGKLDGLLDMYWAKKLVREARIVLAAVRDIKKMANIRLSLDLMALRLGGALNE